MGSFPKIILLEAILIGFLSAAPEDFVQDPDAYRNGTHDRLHRPQVVYVDEDGTLLYPVVDKLSPGGRQHLEKTLALLDGNLKEKFELRIYIHPKAKWADIQDFVSWISKQELGGLSLRIGMMVEDK